MREMHSCLCLFKAGSANLEQGEGDLMTWADIPVPWQSGPARPNKETAFSTAYWQWVLSISSQGGSWNVYYLIIHTIWALRNALEVPSCLKKYWERPNASWENFVTFQEWAHGPLGPVFYPYTLGVPMNTVRESTNFCLVYITYIHTHLYTSVSYFHVTVML